MVGDFIPTPVTQDGAKLLIVSEPASGVLEFRLFVGATPSPGEVGPHGLSDPVSNFTVHWPVWAEYFALDKSYSPPET